MSVEQCETWQSRMLDHEGCFGCSLYGEPDCPEKTVKPAFVKEDGKYYQIKDGQQIERWEPRLGLLLSKGMTVEEQIYFICWKKTVD